MRVGVPPCSLAHCGAPWLVASWPCHCLITAGLASMDGPQLVSSDESQLCERPPRGGTVPVDWLRGIFPCFDHLPSFSRYEAAFLRVLCFDISPSLRDEVTLSGRVLSQSLIGTKALPPPSWCLVGAFAMRSPLRVEYFSHLDRNEDSSRTFPRVWCRTFAMGLPVSGRVAYFCTLDWNERLFHPSILNCFAMGSPYGSSVVFPPA